MKQAHGNSQDNPGSKLRMRRIGIAGLAVVILMIGSYLAFRLSAPDVNNGPVYDSNTADQPGGLSAGQPSSETPLFRQEVVAAGRQNPWDIRFLPDGAMLFTERAGKLNVIKAGTSAAVSQIAAVAEVKQYGGRSEGGLLGLAIDPQFSQNRYVYLCYNSAQNDVRITRWKLSEKLDSLQDKRDIVTGITANSSGRHSGCRMDFGPDGYLWIGTGDSATGSQPQQPRSLNGKILRVDRSGVAAPGNAGNGFDSRVYSYGHRNTQGIAFFPAAKNGVPGLSSEHGSSVDDEVNELRSGNFGWAPGGPPYDEDVAMTNTSRFPDAVRAIWSSGSPTQAPSGMAIINGPQWKGWSGAAVVAFQKDQHLKILRLDAQNKVTREEKVLDGDYGRLRTVVQAPDGNLYVATDNGEDDKIIRLTPQ